MRVAFETLGCRSNHADTVELQGLLVGADFTPCALDASPDVIVINSCTVTDEADRETLRCIRRAREANPEARLLVTGCMAEVAEHRLADTGMVDKVLGPNDRQAVAREIVRLGSGQTAVPLPDSLASPAVVRAAVPHYVGPGELLGEVPTRSRFHLRVQEGCENSCTFCIIPETRGALRSRPIAELLTEVRKLEECGFHEIVLTGTHLGGFGEDRDESLIDLLEQLEKSCRQSTRIRLSSLDPNDVCRDLIDLCAGSKRICNHLHICLQAMDDTILKRMNRRYRLADAEALLDYAKKRFAKLTLGSDIITGFPGESREQVEEQLRVFRELPLSYLHVFPYSARQDTAATRLNDQIAISERRRRAARWRAEANRRWVEHSRSFIGEELEVVLEHGGSEEKISGGGAGADILFGTSREFLSVFLAVATPLAPQAGLREAELRPGMRVEAVARSWDVVQERLNCELSN